MFEIKQIDFLKDLWDADRADALSQDPLALLRYRSNLLGADLRITNFGGGNTSSKFEMPDPLTGVKVRILAVKGSGGDLGAIQESGFAVLYLDRLAQLKKIYGGEEHEDEIVRFYPLCAFAENRVVASIDTPLHAFLPFPHVDHLHPDWAIALAASANGKGKLEEFNRRFNRKIIWMPWLRPGFELAMSIEAAVRDNPETEGILLGGHGLFTWGQTQRECYLNSINTINQMGAFVVEHQEKKGAPFGGLRHRPHSKHAEITAEVLPVLRGELSSSRRVIAHYRDDDEALTFARSHWSKELAALGTSCPDHFLRTKICPLFVDWNPDSEDVHSLKKQFRKALAAYRASYRKYYETYSASDSPRMRDPNPTVVIVPGVGLFGFAKNKKEARITTDFFINAIHVMAGATALEGSESNGPVPQARHVEQSREFAQFHNYVALPRSEAFRIEYWSLEEAKLQRMPREPELSRRIALVIGGGSGIGREVCLLLARKGAHVMVADVNGSSAEATAADASAIVGADWTAHTATDVGSAQSITQAIQETVLRFGGIDAIVNTAAVYPVPWEEGELNGQQWESTFRLNVTANYLLCRTAQRVFQEQGLPGAVVLTSSANAVVPKPGSEAYDSSKAALTHLVRELAIRLAPHVRVNAIAPATVVAGSAMFPRERVMQSLEKYKIGFSQDDTIEVLRAKLAEFYSQRTLTKQPILPQDCAYAILWLLSDESAKTTGHVIPVDGGLPEAFLR